MVVHGDIKEGVKMPPCPCKDPVPSKNGWTKDTRWGTKLATCIHCGHSISKRTGSWMGIGGQWRHGSFGL